MKLSPEYIAEFVNNSNWIEGIETSFMQIEHYATNGDSEGYGPHTFNHVDAVRYVENNYERKPTIEDVITLHGILLEGIDDRIGELRDGSVSIVETKMNPMFFAELYMNDFDPHNAPPMKIQSVKRECPKPKALKRMLNAWIKLWDQKLKDGDVAEECLVRHYEYEHIHPFFDGNGRSGRLLYLWDQLSKGVKEPLIITHQGKRKNYYDKIEEYIDIKRKGIRKRWYNET